MKQHRIMLMGEFSHIMDVKGIRIIFTEKSFDSCRAKNCIACLGVYTGVFSQSKLNDKHSALHVYHRLPNAPAAMFASVCIWCVILILQLLLDVNDNIAVILLQERESGEVGLSYCVASCECLPSQTLHIWCLHCTVNAIPMLWHSARWNFIAVIHSSLPVALLCSFHCERMLEKH